MSIWMSESEFRRSGALSLGLHMDPVVGVPEVVTEGVTLNVPFLNEIKQDFDFRQTLNVVYQRLNSDPDLPPREAAEALAELRDQLETYFAMEEFYGYFHQSDISNPLVTHKADLLQTEHETLFVKLNKLVDLAEQIVYHECSSKITVADVAEELDSFCECLARHEHSEMDLMMRLHNEDIGVGD